MMSITEVKISLRPEQEPLKAFASITFDSCFVVHDLRVIHTKGKTFVAMPSKKIKDYNQGTERHKDIAHPINKEMRELIEKTVLDKYNETLQNMTEPNS